MNILYLANHLNTGGITSYLFSLASGMKKKGHNIFVASHSGERLDKFLRLGVNFIEIPIKTKKEISAGVLFSYLKLSKELKKNKIDIVHSNSRTTQVLGCLLSKFGNIAHLSTCHGYFKRRPLRLLFPCWGMKVIAISEQVKEHLIHDFKVDESRIRVINNGIDLARFAIKNETVQRGAPVVGIIARLSDVKGHIYLIRAMKIVLEKFPRLKLLVVGEGKMYNILVKLAQELNIEKSVEFILRTEDTRIELAAMDIFVMPSLKEGLGLALMEAMASGKAVVGTDVGGIKSLIKDRANGLLVKPADSQALAAAIIELLSNPAEAENYGQEASKFIAENFPLAKMVDQTEKVYLECV
ncbi:MAG: glycosyltransferase family 4 protein [Candidatus Omnitrophota bacterium]|jgi:glycosyltransferase involved in cell wall biosynthesis